MPCGCNANKKAKSAAQLAVAKVRVYCPTCEMGLIGTDGIEYPLHLTPVIVPTQQVNVWKNAGYSIEILN